MSNYDTLDELISSRRDDIYEWATGRFKQLMAEDRLDDALALAAEMIDRNLSVRQAEKLVQSLKEPKKKPAAQQRRSPDTIALEDSLTESLGLKVKLKENKTGNSGVVSLAYSNLDQLDMILKKLDQ